MPGTGVAVQSGALACSHQGSATISSVSARLTVGGKGVLLSGEEATLDFLGCTNQTTSNPPSPAPCVSDAATGGVATKLTVGGTPVVLATALGPTHPKTTPAVPGTWSVRSAGQIKLKAA
jgi:hypothetical protein